MMGYDPKWSLTQILVRFEGYNGAITSRCLKTEAAVNFYNGAMISTLSEAFPDGALRIPDLSKSYFAVGSTGFYVSLAADILIEQDFLPTSWGGGGRRVMFGSRSLVAFLSPDDRSLRVSVKHNTAWYEAFYVIPDPDAFLGVKHSLRFKSTSQRIVVELDGQEVINVLHGQSSFASEYQQPYFGNTNYPGLAADQCFIGYLGQFRVTYTDLRPENDGVLLDRFEAYGALDQYREAVTSHCHFDAENGTTIGLDSAASTPVVFTGAATIQNTTSPKFGISSASLAGGTVFQDGNDFSGDFTIQWWVKRTENNGLIYTLLSIMNADNSAPRIELKAPYFGPISLEVDGVEVVVGINSGVAPTTTWRDITVERSGEWLSVFANGNRVILYSVGESPLETSGRYVLGPSRDWVDEVRVTSGLSRNNVLATTIGIPVYPHTEYGPSYCGGTTENPDGTVRPNTLVRVYHRRTGRLVSEGYSDQDGAYTLPTADTSQHVVVHLHDDDDVNAVVDDHVYPVLIS